MSEYDGTKVTTGRTMRTAAERRAHRDVVQVRNRRLRRAERNDFRTQMRDVARQLSVHRSFA